MGAAGDGLSELFASLDFDHIENEATEPDLWGMSMLELDSLIRRTDRELMQRGELLAQRTDEARTMFARRGAAKIVLENKKAGRGRTQSEG